MPNRLRVSTTFPRRLEDHGVPPGLVLGQADLPPGLFDQEKILVSTEELFALSRGIAGASATPDRRSRKAPQACNAAYRTLTPRRRRNAEAHTR